jgi:LacI family transcriptional regulator
VAKLAGVSVATVSRVINNSMTVTQDTRVKVENAVRKVNYKPHLLARGLRSRSGNLIGLVVPEVIMHAFSCFVSYTDDSLIEAGYNMILGNTHGDPDREEKFIDNLIRMNVSGIIFSRVSDKSRAFRILESTNIPIVVLDRSLQHEDVPHVVLDNYEAGRLAASHLYGLGHRSTACVTGPLEISLCRERMSGFLDYYREKGIEIAEELCFEGNFKFESGEKAAHYLIKPGSDITAVWAQSDLMAVGFMKRLQKANKRIPDDISIVGMDDIDLSAMIDPALTTIRQPFRQMCEKAVELILLEKELGRENLDHKHIVLKPELVVRDTTKSIV